MLTDTMIRAAKPAPKPQKLFDEKGLYLVVMPSGGRLWRFKYRFPKRGPLRKERLLALGPYPEISLRAARDRKDEARKDLANGIDPALKRKCEQASPGDTFKAVALELIAVLRKASLAGEVPSPAAAEAIEPDVAPYHKRRVRQREPISAKTIDTMQRRLDMHIFPYIGSYHVGEITGPQLLEVLRRIESRGTLELAHRLRSVCGRVFRYAKATGRQCENVAADLSDLLIPFESEHVNGGFRHRVLHSKEILRGAAAAESSLFGTGARPLARGRITLARARIRRSPPGAVHPHRSSCICARRRVLRLSSIASA